MSQYIEDVLPPIQSAGLNTQKNVSITGTLVSGAQTVNGAMTVTGVSTLSGGANITGATVRTYTPQAANITATLTAAQVAAGYITSTSAAAVTLTLPTGTLLGAAVGATAGTVLELFIDNTAGANTVTIAVAVNGILSAGAAAVAASFGLLTIPSGVTGQARFTIMFSSATAYTFTRTA